MRCLLQFVHLKITFIQDRFDVGRMR